MQYQVSTNIYTDDKVSTGYFVPQLIKLMIAISSDKEQQHEMYATHTIDIKIDTNSKKRTNDFANLFLNQLSVYQQPP